MCSRSPGDLIFDTDKYIPCDAVDSAWRHSQIWCFFSPSFWGPKKPQPEFPPTGFSGFFGKNLQSPEKVSESSSLQGQFFTDELHCHGALQPLCDLVSPLYCYGLCWLAFPCGLLALFQNNIQSWMVGMPGHNYGSECWFFELFCRILILPAW